MSEERDTHTEGPENNPRRWRLLSRRPRLLPLRWRLLWAVSMVVTLVTTILLITNLNPAIWEDLLDERVASRIGIVVALAVIVVLLAAGGASLEWTGFANRTVWEWLQLLIVPLALTAIGLWFTLQQDVRQQAIEEQRADDAALQAYLDQMGSLLLEKNLRSSDADSEVRTLARARTLTTLEGLDSDRKTQLMLFLTEAKLVQDLDVQDVGENQNPMAARDPIILLIFADLRGADLTNADLRGADLFNADLRDADLGNADLREARLSSADLRAANFIGADLRGADLDYTQARDADFGLADLRDADLRGAEGVTEKYLEEWAKHLEGATMPDGSKHS